MNRAESGADPAYRTVSTYRADSPAEPSAPSERRERNAMFPLSGPAQDRPQPSEIRHDTGWG
ncbi:hypothetical protein ADK74_34180 [Streptomyces decoyicus]|nr:hypothetical protein ADK74_34180 [Streptomyces decoyicus]